MGYSTASVKEPGYDPVDLAAATEKVVVAGNRRKYANLARPLRFYGGTTSATEVGCNLRCAFCFMFIKSTGCGWKSDRARKRAKD